MSQPVIEVRNVSKAYYIGHATEERNLQNTLLHLAMAPLKRAQSLIRTQLPTDADTEFWALRDITMDVYKGETVGIVGKNGSGKSTLLKIISRVVNPTEGHVRTWGRLGTLLEVNAGFNPELTGRENVYLKAAHHGLSTQETDEIFDAIVDFSEIPNFLDTPMKRFSTGMRVRLGFAVNAMMDPDIFIVDEAFAVGDAAFREKCIRFLESFKEKDGKTVLLVSHSTAYIKRLCERIVWLKDGEMAAMGETDEKIDDFLAYLMKPLQITATDEDGSIIDPGDDEMELTGVYNASDKQDNVNTKTDFATIDRVTLLNHRENEKEWIDSEQPFHVDIEYTLHQPLTGQMSIKIATYPTDFTVATFGDADANSQRRSERSAGSYHARLTVPPHLIGPGEYAITAAIHNPMDDTVFASFEFLRLKVGAVNSPLKEWYTAHRRPGVVGAHLDWEYLSDEPVAAEANSEEIEVNETQSG